ncbi:tail assembly chaperone [Colwellia phage 9A]|uniref:Uncharacterized protein n=1 Tax=Colwellia phage 9A TaxID=765765 RepID=I3UMI9_9CAUD|nr:tail assembly chaperone [Colwellia phage 9A]AFK66704.1 hypothetical protein COPG_00108 [Colwellia phage 9A]
MIYKKTGLSRLKKGDTGTFKMKHWKQLQHFYIKERSDNYIIMGKRFDTESKETEFCLRKTLENECNHDVFVHDLHGARLASMTTRFSHKKVKGGYELLEDYMYMGYVKPLFEIRHKYFTIFPNGLILIKKGYQWNGANVIKDTKQNLRASLVHDAYCQAMALKILPMSYRLPSDRTYKKLCKSDGMNKYWAGTQFFFLRAYGLIKFRN